MISYHTGDVTEPDLDGMIAIVHVLSDTGAYGKGVAAAIAQRYPAARWRFQAWARGGESGTRRQFELGAHQWVAVGHDWGRPRAWDDRWVVNMVAQHGLRSASNPHPLDFDALERCLRALTEGGMSMPLAMPRIGCGFAGSSWDKVEPVIAATLKDVDVHVYDLPTASASALR